MSKKLKYDLILQVPAGSVTAGPPIATTLGPKGVPLGLFAKAVNDQTSSLNKGWVVRLRVKIYDDKSYDSQVLGYSTRELIFKKLNLDKGSSTPGHVSVATLSASDITEIASQKFPELNKTTAFNMISGTARSMGIKIE